MMEHMDDPMSLSAKELARLLQPGVPLFPELDALRACPAAAGETPAGKWLLAVTADLVENPYPIPETRYSLYRLFVRTGDRGGYEEPYFGKRATLSAAALRLFLGESRLKDIVQDYLWSLFEETNWVLPAHEAGATTIDLFAAETAFLLGQTVQLLGEGLDPEVRERARAEVERRVFTPYLTNPEAFHWYRGTHNWNGVCNSSVAAAFLLLEPDRDRAARAVVTALSGLRSFLDNAFEADGASTEGVGYWQYGLENYIALAEMLRAASAGAIDLLDTDKMHAIAAYPAKVHLSGACFASFSDCDETISFNPGILSRLSLRTGEDSLRALITGPTLQVRQWYLQAMLRNMLWWDGQWGSGSSIADSFLPSASVVRLTAHTAQGVPVVLALKGGHNAEHHNQNDVGSFILNVEGENLLVDPGRGLYDRAYFSGERYNNLFANSYGHSVPRIGGLLQAPGKQFAGKLAEVNLAGPVKSACLEFGHAYPVEDLESATRRWLLSAEGRESGVLRLHDMFRFSGTPRDVEEAFVTWSDVQVEGSTVRVRGEQRMLCLTIEAPAGACWEVEHLEEGSQANHKPGILKRIRCTLPAAPQLEARFRLRVE